MLMRTTEYGMLRCRHYARYAAATHTPPVAMLVDAIVDMIC